MLSRAHELPDYTPSGIAKAVLSECDRLGDPPSMTVSGTSLRMLAADYLRLAGEAERLREALKQIVETPYRDWHLNAKIARAALADRASK